MSIDADLNAGMISEQEARERREKVSREADFYGAMDGASKFVKGDAIAGIIIVINQLIFGIIIGVLQLGYAFGEAAAHFSTTNCRGWNCQSNSCTIISTATGIVVTRAASNGNLGQDITTQLFHISKMLYVTGGTIFCLGLFTPIDDLLTIPLLDCLSFGGYDVKRSRKGKERIQEIEEEVAS